MLSINFFNENLIHFIWQHRLTNQGLTTIQNTPIEILDVGTINQGEGPDFLNAKIKVDNIILAGNIEIDKKTSLWKAHKHHQNPLYKNIILHLVWTHDVKSPHIDIPILELQNFVPKILLQKYQQLMENQEEILCCKLQKTNPFPTLNMISFYDRLVVERIENKTNTIKKYLNDYHQNWEQVFFILLMKNFGYTQNESAFEKIAIQTDIRVFAKNKHQELSIYAILFGQAGLLEKNFLDFFPSELKKEYLFLAKKYALVKINEELHFGKMRPANFPTIRLAQMASLILNSTHLFSKILECKNIKDILVLFDISINEYFQQHYILDKLSEFEIEKKMGLQFIHNLIINTIIPIVFIYGKINQQNDFCEKALRWLEEIPTEKNHIINQWKLFGLKPLKANESQALIQLYKNYCLPKKCLNCDIGFYLLKQK